MRLSRGPAEHARLMSTTVLAVRPIAADVYRAGLREPAHSANWSTKSSPRTERIQEASRQGMPVAEVKACSASPVSLSQPQPRQSGCRQGRDKADLVRPVPLVGVQGEETSRPTPVKRRGRPGLRVGPNDHSNFRTSRWCHLVHRGAGHSPYGAVCSLPLQHTVGRRLIGAACRCRTPVTGNLSHRGTRGRTPEASRAARILQRHSLTNSPQGGSKRTSDSWNRDEQRDEVMSS
jgi:hypothetical protein